MVDSLLLLKYELTKHHVTVVKDLAADLPPLKLEKNKMSGREGKADYYYLEDVPWIMYFNKDMALHGAYWHDRFGYQHSHGCVNLSPLDAKWLFDWTSPAYVEGEEVVYPSEAEPGTWVWVHE